jgi:hypothetical protein
MGTGTLFLVSSSFVLAELIQGHCDRLKDMLWGMKERWWQYDWGSHQDPVPHHLIVKE